MRLFDQIELLAKVAACRVQDKLQQEALERGELYIPRKRPGVGPKMAATIFWRAWQIYHADKSLSVYAPESDDEEQDRFKRMLSAVSHATLLEVTGREPPEDDIHVMRSILGWIFSYRKNGRFDQESKIIAGKLGLLKSETT